MRNSSPRAVSLERRKPRSRLRLPDDSRVARQTWGAAVMQDVLDLVHTAALSVCVRHIDGL